MSELIQRGLKTGGLMTAATAAAMMASSHLEKGSPWASLNAMATAIGVGGRRVGDAFKPDLTPVGLATLTGGLIVWGLGYQAVLGGLGRRRPLLAGVLSALGGYAIDEIVLPRWVVPNFRRKMGVGGTIAKYTALGLASALAARWFRDVGESAVLMKKTMKRYRAENKAKAKAAVAMA